MSGSWSAGSATDYTHDPLCRGRYQRITDPLHCTDCDLIAKVRAEYERPTWLHAPNCTICHR